MPLVDLDEPDELRARWAALAAVAHATGFDRRWYADDDGYHHQDETASVLRMTRLGDGRVVLWGFHTQHSATAGADLLAGSPDWIGQPEVRQRQTAGELGFVYGAFNGTWARASYPGDPWQPVDDGFEPIGGWITSDEAAADEMIEWVAGWADYLGGLDELRPYGVELIRTALGSGITAEALGAFFAPFRIDPRSPVQPDLPAGVAAGEDFVRNFAVPASFPDDPDTAEVSVVEEVVIGAPDSRPSGDEESYVVPPGISPFTGQPIDDPPPPHVEPVGPDGADGADGQEEYGLTAKKQSWLRRRRPDAPADPDPDHGPDPEAYTAGPAPGTYLPDDVDGTGLPTPQPTYDPVLPSAEPPRVGGGRYEGDDFYNSLFADAPAAAAPAADEQDWETAEQPSWSNQEPTSEYNPFADDTAAPEWTGPAWINGQWVEDPSATAQPTQPAAAPPDSPFAPAADLEDDDAPTAEIAAVLDTGPAAGEAEEPASFTGPSPFAPAESRYVEPASSQHPGEPDPADQPGQYAGDPLGRGAWEGSPSDPGTQGSDQLPVDADADDQTAEIPAVVDESGVAQTSDVPSASREMLQREADGVVSEIDRRANRFEAMDDDEDEIFGRPAAWTEPGPGPSPEPFPGPGPSPEPFPGPGPSPQPFPSPEPTPVPDPEPQPDPERTPPPEPEPNPEPVREHELPPWPDPEDEEPTGFVPVVEDEPVGDAVAERMSIPGLGLVGGGGPRIVPQPGSIEEAMRAESERPRPRPQESDAVLALRAWCRARTAIVPSGFTIQVQVLDPGAPSYRFDLEPPDVDDPEYASDKLSGLLGDLWLTEQESDQGGWLFARIDAAGRTLRIDRWYDQVPDWWDNPIEPRLDVNGLVRRLYSRGPQWQPSYLERLYTSAR